MAIVERRFKQQEPKPEPTNDFIDARPLTDFYKHDALVVLGDPGAGKTTSFKQAANSEPNAMYVTMNSFLNLNVNRYQGKTLYLDGLDEERSKTNDGTSALDKIRGKLDELNCPCFRLSCRSADWYGSSDLDNLKEVTQSKSRRKRGRFYLISLPSFFLEFSTLSFK